MIDLTDNDIDNILSSGKDMYTYFKDKYAIIKTNMGDLCLTFLIMI